MAGNTRQTGKAANAGRMAGKAGGWSSRKGRQTKHGRTGTRPGIVGEQQNG
jgi:hypothetical protein